MKLKKRKEKIIQIFFFINGAIASLFMFLIFIFLLNEAAKAFFNIGLENFIFERKIMEGKEVYIYEWKPTSEFPAYSLIPLLIGSFLTAFPATLVSAFIGVCAGVYLSEIAKPKTREIFKPVVELFAGIPTVIIGFLALTFFSAIFYEIFNPPNLLNAALGAFGLSLIAIPIITSLTEEALRSVPFEIRMASYGMGATKWQTIYKVLIPAAFSGISSGILLAFGRAVGETMIVLMATGNAGNIGFNLFESVRTMTATIAAEMGEATKNSDHYYALFLIGAVLFTITFIINIVVGRFFSIFKKRYKI